VFCVQACVMASVKLLQPCDEAAFTDSEAAALLTEALPSELGGAPAGVMLAARALRAARQRNLTLRKVVAGLLLMICFLVVACNTALAWRVAAEGRRPPHGDEPHGEPGGPHRRMLQQQPQQQQQQQQQQHSSSSSSSKRPRSSSRRRRASPAPRTCSATSLRCPAPRCSRAAAHRRQC
jgi:hypothetical protein